AAEETEEPAAEPTEEPAAEETEKPTAEPTEEPAAEETEEFYEEERPRHRVTVFKVFVSFTTILAVMTALFVVLLFVLSDNSLLSPKIEVDMPNFNGMEASQIKEDPKFSEFQIEYEDVYTEEAEKGIVIDQRPKAPRQVKENAHITLRVSAGIQTVEVPDVAGMSREEAKATLKKSNLNVLFKPVADDAVDEEDVVETDPKSGTVLNAGETVIVYISRGEQEAMTAKVPSCVGLASTSAAGQLLGSRGLTLGGVREVASGSPAGTVIGQSPPAGKVLPRGSGVTITVSTGAPVAVTPGVGNEVVGADGHVHQYVAQVVAPNSYSIGFTMHTCTICGYYYYDNVKNPV
ncbi:MAG: PASTA domain-containing protein, partial [Ruthenibacterium sp.]